MSCYILYTYTSLWIYWRYRGKVNTFSRARRRAAGDATTRSPEVSSTTGAAATGAAAACGAAGAGAASVGAAAAGAAAAPSPASTTAIT